MVAVLKSEPRAWHMLEVFFTTKLHCPPRFTFLSQVLTKLPGLANLFLNWVFLPLFPKQLGLQVSKVELACSSHGHSARF